MIKEIIKKSNDNNIIAKFGTIHTLIRNKDTGINAAFRQTLEAILKHILEIEKISLTNLKEKKQITCKDLLGDINFKNKLFMQYGVTNSAINSFVGIIYDGNRAIHEDYNVFEKSRIKYRYKYLVLILINMINMENLLEEKIKMTEKQINEEFEELFIDDKEEKGDKAEVKTHNIKDKKIEISDIINKDEMLKSEIEKINKVDDIVSDNILIKIYDLVQLVEKFVKQNNDMDEEELEISKYKNLFELKKYLEGIYQSKSIIDKKEEIIYEIIMFESDIREELYEYGFRILSWLKVPESEKIIENRNQKEQIASIINEIEQEDELSYWLDGRFYINNIKPFFVNEKIFFEIDVAKATNEANQKSNISKVFSTIKVRDNYTTKLKVIKKKIRINKIENDIYILVDYDISIRPVEISNLIYILTGQNIKNNISYKDKFYKSLNKYINDSNLNLLEIISSHKFKDFIKCISTESEASILFCQGIEKARKIILKDEYEGGGNILRYLLSFTRNRVLNEQKLKYITAKDFEENPKDENVINEFKDNKNNKLLNNIPDLRLFIIKDDLKFERHPIAYSLYGHQTLFRNIIKCIDISDRKYEILARFLTKYCEDNQSLYVPRREFENFGDIDELIEIYNQSLKQKYFRIEKKADYIFKNDYKDKTKKILDNIKEFTTKESDFDKIKEKYFINHPKEFDVNKPININQKEIIKDAFKNSRIMLLYGEAGTGKTELMCNYLTRLFISEGYKICYVSNTHSTKNNMMKRVKTTFGNDFFQIENKTRFLTVKKYTGIKFENDDSDVLIMDECKSISTFNMCKMLNKLNNKKFVVLAGDIGQIDAIGFGNWFPIVYNLVDERFRFELNKNERTQNKELCKLWKMVRNQDKETLSYLKNNDYIKPLNSEIFENKEEDEIILCWNYNGFYGINSMNTYFQGKNMSKVEIQNGLEKFKKGDPIVFNGVANEFATYQENGDIIYNNLKGTLKWVEIKKYNEEEYLEFEIEVNDIIKNINNNEVQKEIFKDSKIYQIEEKGTSLKKETTTLIIRTRTNRDRDSKDSEIFVDIPFDIAYAMSLHKGQGLEFNSVKLVITPESEELFNNEAFYTAITRAKNKLKIYTTFEGQEKLLDILTKKTVDKDIELLTSD